MPQSKVDKSIYSHQVEGVLNALPCGVWCYQSDGTINYVNISLCQMLGKPAADLVGMGILSLVHPDERDALQAFYFMGEGGHGSVEVRMRGADGSWRWYRHRSGGYFTADVNRQRLIVGTVTDVHDDVTERKRADEVLLFGKQEAERANSLKAQFLANMSHEIRTPLGVMIGLTEVLRDADLGEAERRVYLETMANNGKHLLSMVDDILDLSKIDANRLAIDKVAVNPVCIANEIVREFEGKTGKRGLTLTYKPAHDTPTELMGDPVRMRQVLLNVVTNAVKFTREGSVTISSCLTRSPNGELGVDFQVTDTGIGIPESEYERIFDVFVQADGSITRRFGGAGLGLPLARKLAQAMGGDVVLQRSMLGRGSTFVVRFVDARKSNACRMKTLTDKADDAHLAPRGSLAGIRVLSVDDALDNQTLVVYFLTRHGARVETAENGLDGYQKAIESNYDLVLMDIQMPVMDGFTATERLRQDGYAGPILALTAHVSEENRTRCIAAGCSDFLAKPILAATLVEKIRQWVNPLQDVP